MCNPECPLCGNETVTVYVHGHYLTECQHCIGIPFEKLPEKFGMMQKTPAEARENFAEAAKLYGEMK